MTSFHAALQRPPQERHFQPRERQYRPEPFKGHDPGNGEGDKTYTAEKQQGGANAERAMRTDLDAMRLGVHFNAAVYFSWLVSERVVSADTTAADFLFK